MERKGEKRINRGKRISGLAKLKPAGVFVEFTFNSSVAENVYLAGEFNNWDIHSIPMRKINEKEWKAALRLMPGRYEYKYFVDGAWVEDVPGAEKAQNSLGTKNLVIYIA
ncbi:glycogen-binding domain-containing protein [bacterium]|nr:glycogen-binding domain-containing protein [bacterium]